jgi:hypothetical protein
MKTVYSESNPVKEASLILLKVRREVTSSKRMARNSLTTPGHEVLPFHQPSFCDAKLHPVSENEARKEAIKCHEPYCSYIHKLELVGKVYR